MTYLIRVNLDIGDKDLGSNLRFQHTVQAVQKFSKKSNKVVILSHHKRPNGKNITTLSLKRFVPFLTKALGRKVFFLPKLGFVEIREKIDKAPKGSVFLLENTRFWEGETENERSIAKGFASLGDKYINDDFPTAHRAHASTYGIAKLLPSQPGPHLKKEVSKLRKAIGGYKNPFVLVLGGAKVDYKLKVASNLLSKTDSILLGGGPANNVLKARGVNIGQSLYSKGAEAQSKKLAKKDKIHTPLDWELDKNAIMDIGSMTIKEYRQILSEARTIIWNGPMGYLEKPPFDKGSRAIAKAILDNKKARSVIGGGDILTHIVGSKKSFLSSKDLFVSTGGGAMLAFLAGSSLPALEAINKQ